MVGGDVSNEAISRQKPQGTTTSRGCLLLFFFVFFMAGLLVVYFFTILPISRSLSAGDWDTANCVILSSEVERHEGDDGDTYSINIVYEYQVGDQTYRGDHYDFTSFSSGGYDGKKAVVDRYPPGSEHPCYVNPDDPADSVLNPGITGIMFVGLVGLVFLAVGAGGMLFSSGLVRFRKGPRRRRAEDFAQFREVARQQLDFDRERSSGPVTLNASQSPLTTLGVVLLFGLFWNGIVSVFVWFAVQSFLEGDPEWFLCIFLIPFVLIGLGMIVFFFYSLLAVFNPRPTLTLETDALRLGDTIRLKWRFSGQTGSIRQLKISLDGKEEAQYRRGTSNYTDTETFCSLLVKDTINPLEIPLGEATVDIPSDTMHSFESPHNKIVWCLQVSGEIGLWPDVDVSFPIEILPLEPQGAVLS